VSSAKQKRNKTKEKPRLTQREDFKRVIHDGTRARERFVVQEFIVVPPVPHADMAVL